MKNRVEQNTLLNKIVAVPFYLKALREKNTAESEYETLREAVEEQLFTEKEKIISLEATVKRQREQIKDLKQELEEAKNANIQRNRKNRQRTSFC